MNQDSGQEVQQLVDTSNIPEVSQDISEASRTQAQTIWNDALDRINDLAANDEVISRARDLYMRNQMGTDTLSEDWDEEAQQDWYDKLCSFYTKLFIGAANIQHPIQTNIAVSLDEEQKNNKIAA